MKGNGSQGPTEMAHQLRTHSTLGKGERPWGGGRTNIYF